jgi:hypothetical protein
MFMRMNTNYSMNAIEDVVEIPWQVKVYERNKPNSIYKNYDLYGGQIEPGEALALRTQRELWEEQANQPNCEVAKLPMLQNPLRHALACKATQPAPIG